MNNPTAPANGFPVDGARQILARATDVAGNLSEFGQLNMFLDTQGPRIYDPDGAGNARHAIEIGGDPAYDLFDQKDADGILAPTPLINSLVINVQDLPNRVTGFLYNALAAATPGNDPAADPGNYRLVGDHNGIIPIQSVVFAPTAPADGAPANGTITLSFANALPDDRFTLTLSDSLVDPANNKLDGESNATEPQATPTFPSGDGVPGGDFVARFTVDSRPEIGTWANKNVYVDTNGKLLVRS